MLAPDPCRAIFRRTRNVLALLRRLRVPSEGMMQAIAKAQSSAAQHEFAAMIDHLIAEGERRGV